MFRTIVSMLIGIVITIVSIILGKRNSTVADSLSNQAEELARLKLKEAFKETERKLQNVPNTDNIANDFASIASSRDKKPL